MPDVMPRVLLIEDNEMNRDMLSRRLRRRGFEVAEASDGEQGCRAALELLPDLILMDMSLPVIDGWTATRMLKSCSITADIPVIALTAHAMTQDRERALECGCDDYDTKPIELSRLLEKISALLKGGKSADRLPCDGGPPAEQRHLGEDSNG
jgi:two-component system cell cycle response regulator DivK